VLISKADLAPFIDDFDPTRAEAALRQIACPAALMTLSAKRKTGLTPWLDWIRNEAAAR